MLEANASVSPSAGEEGDGWDRDGGDGLADGCGDGLQAQQQQQQQQQRQQQQEQDQPQQQQQQQHEEQQPQQREDQSHGTAAKSIRQVIGPQALGMLAFATMTLQHRPSPQFCRCYLAATYGCLDQANPQVSCVTEANCLCVCVRVCACVTYVCMCVLQPGVDVLAIQVLMHLSWWRVLQPDCGHASI